MPGEEAPKEVTVEDIYLLLKSRPRGPGISWMHTILQIVISLLVVGTAAVIYVGKTAEKESEEAVAPVITRVEVLEKATADSVKQMEESATRSITAVGASAKKEVQAIRRTIEGSERKSARALDEIRKDVDSMAQDQRDITKKLHEFDIRQAVMETDLKQLKETPRESP